MNKMEMAVDYHKQGYNCAQAVVLAYADEIGLNHAMAAKIAEPFGGGMGRMREVCGAVSGMLMVLGSRKAQGEATNPEARKKLYEETRQMADEFRETAGSIVCGELLGLPAEGSMPEGQYTRRPCEEYVRIAAEVVGRLI